MGTRYYFSRLMDYCQTLGVVGENWRAVEAQYQTAVKLGINEARAFESARNLATQIGAPAYLRKQAC